MWGVFGEFSDVLHKLQQHKVINLTWIFFLRKNLALRFFWRKWVTAGENESHEVSQVS